jgi:hypothetical protein
MNTNKAAWILVLIALALVPAARAQGSTQPAKTAIEADTPANPDAQKNIQEYIELMRSDVRQRKAETLATVMQLSAADAAKFWPIYADYDAELAKMNDLRVANIQEYARAYDEMTNERADELMQKALAYRKQRPELVAKYYGRVKQVLGASTAARFFQIEDQLLSIIDLQIASSLPIVGKSS